MGCSEITHRQHHKSHPGPETLCDAGSALKNLGQTQAHSSLCSRARVRLGVPGAEADCWLLGERPVVLPASLLDLRVWPLLGPPHPSLPPVQTQVAAEIKTTLLSPSTCLNLPTAAEARAGNPGAFRGGRCCPFRQHPGGPRRQHSRGVPATPVSLAPCAPDVTSGHSSKAPRWDPQNGLWLIRSISQGLKQPWSAAPSLCPDVVPPPTTHRICGGGGWRAWSVGGPPWRSAQLRFSQ